MDQIKSVASLEQNIKECTAVLNAKLKGEGGKRAVVVCGGTGCIANNSVDIEAELVKQIEAAGLADRVSVNHVGCFGFCSQGPFVKIFPEDTLYRAVKVKDVKEIIEKDIIGGEICENLLYVDPQTHE